MKLDQARDIVRLLVPFFPGTLVTDETIDAYATRLKPYDLEKARRTIETWIETQDVWPSWAQLKRKLGSSVPKSLADQGGKPALIERTERALIEELERKARPDEPSPISEASCA